MMYIEELVGKIQALVKFLFQINTEIKMKKQCYAKEHKCICKEIDSDNKNQEVLKYEITEKILPNTQIGKIKVFDRENNMYYDLKTLLK